jgi:regulator of protease activity HflC (stomatin/prohibitin superfamily)
MSSSVLFPLCFLGITLLITMIFMASAIRIVPEYQRLVVFRLGRCIGAVGPGIVLLLPTIDRGLPVDLREQTREQPAMPVRTRDQRAITLRLRWQYQVIDPVASLMQVGNLDTAIQELVATAQRELITALPLAQVPADDELARLLVARINETTERWGAHLKRIEILERVSEQPAGEQATGEKAIMVERLVHSIGQAQTSVYTEGTVEVDGKGWKAVSRKPVAPGKKVRVIGVVLEVEEF